jgi:HD-like signal output (HDOD) protein
MLRRPDERIAKIFKSLCDIPSLPAAVEKLVQLSEKDATPREFADLIEQDQGLTAKVLRLVNSAFYSLRSPIASLRHASALLGTRTLKSLALSVSVINLLQRPCPGLDPVRFWKHSIFVAAASRKLAARFLPALEEDLHVAGLLHDVGVVIFAQHLSNDYSRVLKAAATGEKALSLVEEEAMGASHAEVGCVLASRWRLPSAVCDAIRWHEADEADWKLAQAENARGVEIVRLADRSATAAGFDFLDFPVPEEAPPPEVPDWIAERSFEVTEIIAGVKREITQKEEFFLPKVAASTA